MITKASIEVDPTTFVPIVKFEGQFKMEPPPNHPYSEGDEAAYLFGKQMLDEIVELLNKKDTPNAYRYNPKA